MFRGARHIAWHSNVDRSVAVDDDKICQVVSRVDDGIIGIAGQFDQRRAGREIGLHSARVIA